MTPSERAAELLLVVRRIRKRTGLDVVPILVVEGASDEAVMSDFCEHDPQQIFAAGNRDLVEQLLRHVRSNPIDGCTCLYLVDCDGYGKTTDLRDETDLLVSETCDLEADLIHLGAALRVVTPFLPTAGEAEDLIDRACRLAMPLSVVRRAAAGCSISMRRNKSQLRMVDFSDLQLAAWAEHGPEPLDVLDVVSRELNWTDEQRSQVETKLPGIPAIFGSTCLGKDALDALFFLLRQEGQGNVRGWNLAFFYKMVAKELNDQDLDRWEVGRRIRAWEESSGFSLVSRPSGSSTA